MEFIVFIKQDLQSRYNDEANDSATCLADITYQESSQTQEKCLDSLYELLSAWQLREPEATSATYDTLLALMNDPDTASSSTTDEVVKENDATCVETDTAQQSRLERYHKRASLCLDGEQQ